MTSSSDASGQYGVSFSERLSLISSIAAAYSRVNPPAEPAVAQAEARKLEDEAYNHAFTNEGYRDLCQDEIDKLDSKRSKHAAEEALTNAFADYDTQPGIELGKYKKAVFVKGTQFSTIYKTKCYVADFVALKATKLTGGVCRPHDPEGETLTLMKVFEAEKSGADCKVLRILDAFHEVGSLYVLAFPYMPYNLDELLRQGDISARQVRSHLKDLFTALAHIHSLGIIHRDVKPSNILVGSVYGPAYLGDFGIAWNPDTSASLEKATDKITDVGTTCYRPPEILFGDRSYGVRLDLWAAGCVVAEAVDMRHEQLFDAGPLGSELSLINSMFTTLGTPNDETWPSAKHLPDWGKVEFTQYQSKAWNEILNKAPGNSRDLVSKLVRFEASQRLNALEALQHPYFGRDGDHEAHD